MENNQNNKPQKNDRRGMLIIIVVSLITALLVMGLFNIAGKSSTEEIPYNEFLKMLQEGKIEEVAIGGSQLTIKPKSELPDEQWAQLFKNFEMTYYTGIVEDETTLSERLEAAGVTYYSEIPDTASALFWNFVLTVILPFGAIFLLMSFMMKKM